MTGWGNLFGHRQDRSPIREMGDREMRHSASKNSRRPHRYESGASWQDCSRPAHRLPVGYLPALEPSTCLANLQCRNTAVGTVGVLRRLPSHPIAGGEFGIGRCAACSEPVRVHRGGSSRVFRRLWKPGSVHGSSSSCSFRVHRIRHRILGMLLSRFGLTAQFQGLTDSFGWVGSSTVLL